MKRALVGAVLLLGCQLDGTMSEPPTPGLHRMIDQPRADAYEATTAFGATAASEVQPVLRPPPRGTVPYRRDRSTPPDRRPALDRALLDEGRLCFDRFCAPCHGIGGDGDSAIAEDMRLRPPPSLLEAEVRGHTDVDLFAIATDGYGMMPGYGAALSRRERWAVVAYVRALQLSRRAPLDALPPDIRADLQEAAP